MTNNKFFMIPGTGEISYWNGVDDEIIQSLVTWIDGDSSFGDCDIGYDEFEDTYTGTFTNGTQVIFDHETREWFEA